MVFTFICGNISRKNSPDTNKAIQGIFRLVGTASLIGADIFTSSLSNVVLNILMVVDSGLASDSMRLRLLAVSAGLCYALAFFGAVVQYGMDLPKLEKFKTDAKGSKVRNVEGYKFKRLSDVQFLHTKETVTTPEGQAWSPSSSFLTTRGKVARFMLRTRFLGFIYLVLAVFEKIVEELLKFRYGLKTALPRGLASMDPQALQELVTGFVTDPAGAAEKFFAARRKDAENKLSGVQSDATGIANSIRADADGAVDAAKSIFSLPKDSNNNTSKVAGVPVPGALSPATLQKGGAKLMADPTQAKSFISQIFTFVKSPIKSTREFFSAKKAEATAEAGNIRRQAQQHVLDIKETATRHVDEVKDAGGNIDGVKNTVGMVSSKMEKRIEDAQESAGKVLAQTERHLSNTQEKVQKGIDGAQQHADTCQKDVSILVDKTKAYSAESMDQVEKHVSGAKSVMREASGQVRKYASGAQVHLEQVKTGAAILADSDQACAT
eukprot:gene23392-28312_t